MLDLRRTTVSLHISQPPDHLCIIPLPGIKLASSFFRLNHWSSAYIWTQAFWFEPISSMLLAQLEINLFNHLHSIIGIGTTRGLASSHFLSVERFSDYHSTVELLQSWGSITSMAKLCISSMWLLLSGPVHGCSFSHSPRYAYK